MSKTATFIKDLRGFRGRARLYRLDPPAPDYDGNPREYVVVSAVDAMFSGPETYIFPASAEGEVVDWLEMDGSFQGDLDHERALANAGYTVR